MLALVISLTAQAQAATAPETNERVLIENKIYGPFKPYGPYLEWDYPELPRELFDYDNGQCVNYAKTLSGIFRTGDAIDWVRYVDSNTPTLKAVMVFDDTHSPLGHLAVVYKIDFGKRIFVVARNVEALWVISTSSFDWDDPSVIGYVTK